MENVKLNEISESEWDSEEESESEKESENDEIKFSLCPDRGHYCRCNFPGLDSPPFRRRHINPVTPWRTLNNRKRRKMKRWCNNSLHTSVSEQGPGTYHFLAKERPTWMYDCKVPSEDEKVNRQIQMICQRVGIFCHCSPGTDLCYTCTTIVKSNQIKYLNKVVSLEPLVCLLPLIDFDKMFKSLVD